MRTKRQPRHRVSGFTLIESMVASGVMALFVTACFSAITFDQVAVRKSKEEAIAMDFLMHYAENIKALPFNCVVPGQPINPLLNGAGGAPNITIPASGSWVPVNTTDYQTFHPDLLWFSNRNPAMQVVVTTNSAGGVPHDTTVNVKIDWDPPMAKGQRLEVEIDLLRTKDL